MLKEIFVRVDPKSGLQKRYRCGMEFTGDWQEVEVDAATARAIDADAYLEAQQTEPDGFERTASADQSSSAAVTGQDGASDTLSENADADLAQGTDNSASDTGSDSVKSAEVAINADKSAVVAPLDDAERYAAIRVAISQLDVANADLWTAYGSPKTDALSAIAGWTVSAADRDAAWALVLADEGAQ